MMKIFVFINGVGTQGGMFLYPIPLIETKLTREWLANVCSGYRNNSLPLTIPGRRILWRRSSRVFSLVYHPLSLAFLVWKDRNGKTLVHLRDCVWFVHTPSLQHSCSCPRHLAFGTVDALIGKLRSTFATQGRGSDWQPLLGVGSLAACRTVKKVPGRCKRGTVNVKNCPLSSGTGPPGWSCSDFSAYWNSAPAKLIFRTFTNLCFGTRSGAVQGVILCRGSGGWSFTVENWGYFAFSG